jgi:hypothetical protein
MLKNFEKVFLKIKDKLLLGLRIKEFQMNFIKIQRFKIYKLKIVKN